MGSYDVKAIIYKNIKSIGDDAFYGSTYTSKSALLSALSNNGVTVNSTAFNNTALSA